MGDSLLIVDLQSHTLGGHFSVWLDRTLREAARHFGSLYVYVADEASKPSPELLQAIPARVTVRLIPDIYQHGRWRGNILGVLAAHQALHSKSTGATPVFLMWAQQFLERDRIFPPRRGLKDWLLRRTPIGFSAPWGTMTSISSVAHQALEIPVMEQRVHDELHLEPSCEAILLWDEYAVQKLGGKYLYLPDIEPLQRDEVWHMPETGPVTLGSVGQLWGYRSVNLLAEILSAEDSVHGYLSGVLKPDSYDPLAKSMLAEKGRLICEEGFAADDQELHRRLSKLDAFVIDSRTYKCPSGLGIRAMAMGRPIVCIDSPSWITSLIREKGVGVFWSPGVSGIADKLRAWYASGGPLRAAAAARELSDLEGLHRAYSTLFTRLKKRVASEIGSMA